MKKISLSVLILAASGLALADRVPSYCGTSWAPDSMCQFAPLAKQPFQTYSLFYCQIDSNVTDVYMEDHNVLISGFNGGGLLHFGKTGDQPISNFNELYFEVLNDPTRNQDDPKLMGARAVGGNIKCTDGTGGRTEILGGFGKKI